MAAACGRKGLVGSMRHVLDLGDMSLEEWKELYGDCRDIMDRPEAYADDCRGHVMASLFYEPSTRTNFSFQTAMLRLGGSVIGFSDPMVTSVSKGETLKDTVIMTSGYADVLVMRHPKEGAAKAASLYSSVPVVNAGDGGHMHPTQTLTDLTTMTKYRGGVEGMHVGLCGDLKNGRTVHSLLDALSKFKDNIFYLIAPRELTIPDYVRRMLRERNQRFYEVTGLDAVMPSLDVLYMTRIQRERFIDPLEYERLRGVYILDKRKMAQAKRDMIVLHPLPRVDEILPEVDDDPRALYFEQARCGMFIRMALVRRIIKSGRQRPAQLSPAGQAHSCSNDRCITRQETYLPRLTKQSGGAECCAYCDKEMRI